MAYEVRYEDPALIAFGSVLLVIGGIVWFVQRLVDAVSGPLTAAWKWLISFHFDNFFECLFHFYIWIVYSPVAVIVLLAAGIFLAGIYYGVYGGYKLTVLMDLGSDFGGLILKIIVGFFLCCLGFGLGAGVAGFIAAPVLFLLPLMWRGICFVKDEVLHMAWLNNHFFGILIYGIIPGLLLTLFLLTR